VLKAFVEKTIERSTSLDPITKHKLNEQLSNKHKEEEEEKLVIHYSSLPPVVTESLTSGIFENEASTEEGLSSVVAEMREVALRFRGTVLSDLAVLDETKSIQSEALSDLKRETKKSESIRAKSSLTFFKTILFVAISLAILLTLAPFIVLTR
jgi:hypothetical protein